MILRRRGTKQLFANDIIQYFPFHKTYIELFFGAGGIFFNKPKAKYNILNDIDEDVYNLFLILQDKHNSKLLLNSIKNTPYHTQILKYFSKNKCTNDIIQKATRFLYLSNYSFLGKMDTLKLANSENSKSILIGELKKTYNILQDCIFSNLDFRKCLTSISVRDETERDNIFVYADPPYIGTNGNYDSFTENDSRDLFDNLEKSKFKWAYSEFNHPFILEQAKSRNLNIIEIGERRNLGNRKMEILVCNYEIELGLFDSLGGASSKEKSLAFV